MNGTIFVTVGTTLFEALIQAVSTDDALQGMVENGYSSLVIQYGKGAKPPILSSPSLNVEVYAFKPNLTSDMKAADLIISHAGAGTVMEVLRLKKRAAVVINTMLMDNHQTELADAMGERHHILVVDNPSKLCDPTMWKSFETFRPLPYTGGNDYDFPRLLDAFMGVTKET
jgi:beta-1,4-N-acetylglucosaminyltransferase